ncbi:MAG: serine/threonine protein kinase, partial [Gemmataceae bacterium]|nr:serine/threonine protein kinase [Gemmataceae bacterium]
MSERDLFLSAIAIPDPAARSAFLDRACGGDPGLRRGVDQLLAAHAEAGSFLDPPPAPGTAGVPPAPEPTVDLPAGPPTGTFGDATASYRPAPEVPETVIAGRYKLLEPIGEGGMGTVWMAQQTEPVKRRVAVKLVRSDRGGSRAILARFEAERQAIALMDHPHIAKLLDAGATAGGEPFFVMELVRGVPLTQFCDARRLTVPERLDLFRQICGAVQHAHQKGIIHRDLKPSNVLVESHDGKPVPKVIDFGLAKAVGGLDLTDRSVFTGFGAVLGTPSYMAPEQATLSAVDVDTRADVYALGVILYELLAGSPPIRRDELKRAALEEMLRAVREDEPPPPSSRISGSAEKPSIAANRQTEPARLGRFVRGELDWVVMKALAKDRDRRYETAAAFGADVGRFLNHEPVAAGPPSAGYKLRKFVARNRGRVAAAGLVLL